MSFRNDVYNTVKNIPPGQIATYGQIAAMIDHPRAARQVGMALRWLTLNEQSVPWWRVVNKRGHISIDHGEGGIEKQIQKDLLLAEGIEFVDELTVNLNKHLWRIQP